MLSFCVGFFVSIMFHCMTDYQCFVSPGSGEIFLWTYLGGFPFLNSPLPMFSLCLLFVAWFTNRPIDLCEVLIVFSFHPQVPAKEKEPPQLKDVVKRDVTPKGIKFCSEIIECVCSLFCKRMSCLNEYRTVEPYETNLLWLPRLSGMSELFVKTFVFKFLHILYLKRANQSPLLKYQKLQKALKTLTQPLSWRGESHHQKNQSQVSKQ